MIRQDFKLTTAEKLYLPAVLKGMWVTFTHFVRPQHYVTIQYPEKRADRPTGYRGFHRLNKDSYGRIKCVACEMCATVCPSHCITVIPMPAFPEWKDRERMPKRFEINLLMCIYCGMCEEACPADAIELTKIHDWSAYSREEMIWDKEKLLKMYDLTIDEHSMAQLGLTLNPQDKQKGT